LNNYKTCASFFSANLENNFQAPMLESQLGP
jgi:hypothetical protein